MSSSSPPLPPSNIQAQSAASMCSAELEDAKFYHSLPPALRAVVGWVNPARLHRISVSAEFCSVRPHLGNAPKCTQILLCQPSSPSANKHDLNLLQGVASLVSAGVVAVHICGDIKVATLVCVGGKI